MHAWGGGGRGQHNLILNKQSRSGCSDARYLKMGRSEEICKHEKPQDVQSWSGCSGASCLEVSTYIDPCLEDWCSWELLEHLSELTP